MDKLQIQFIRSNPDSVVPSKAYPGDAGFDLYSCAETIVPPRSFADVPTGINVALPDGYWVQICSRSSTFRKHKVQVVDAVIDNGYRGELFIQVINPGDTHVLIPKHTRIAQVIPHRIHDADWIEVVKLPTSERGDRGFGSSGR